MQGEVSREIRKEKKKIAPEIMRDGKLQICALQDVYYFY